jgi:thiol:disulfide interchange protein
VTTYRKAAIVFLAIAITAFLFHIKTGKQASSDHVTTTMLERARMNANGSGKSLMVQFGADWCSDCVELTEQLQEKTIRNYLNANFVVLKVDVGEFNRNIDLAKSLGIDVTVGIPTAVFFPSDGTPQSSRRGTEEILSYLRERAN